MKHSIKLTSIIFAFILIFTLISCAEQVKTITADTSVLSAEIMEKYNFPAMYEVSADELEAEFNMSSEYFSSFTAFTTEEPYGIERIFIGLTNDASASENAKSELENYFQMIKDQSENYDAVEFAKAEDAQVYTQANLVCLIICEKSDEALNTLKSIIK